MSDHLPIICSLHLPGELHHVDSTDKVPSIAWNKAVLNGSILDYSFAVSHNLWTLDMKQTDIETYYSKIVSAVTDAARDTLPTLKFKRHLKPYWNDNLSTLHRNMIQTRDSWIADNRPRRMTHETYKNYKHSKNNFRSELRKAYENHVAEASMYIEKSVDVDQRAAWSIINSRRSRNCSDIFLKNENSIINDPENVCSAFANHFENVAKNSESCEDSINSKLLSLIRKHCA